MHSTPRPEAPPAPVVTPATPPEQPPELLSETLLLGGSEVLIRHGEQLYRLRHTRNDKLILTK